MSKTATYFIFERRASAKDARVLWHRITEVNATSRPDALREFVKTDPCTDRLGDNCVIDRTTDCVMTIDCYEQPCLIMAERADRIDFSHYDIAGNRVEGLVAA